jgi:nucleotide-binding universal stress UspA family protein
VLVPLDGSPLADDALDHALATYDCPVTVLNVVTPLDASMSESGLLDDAAEGRVADARDRADSLVADAADRAARSGRSVDTAVEVGDPAEAIVEYADANDVDHVVMGGHGGPRRPVTRRLLGTVATDVVGEAPVTVTVVR